MKRLIAAFFLALATPVAAEPIELPVNLADGATWTIETKRTRTAQRDGKPQEVVTTARYRAEYGVDKSGGVITLEETDSTGGGDLPANVDLSALDEPLVIEVDESLAPERLRNWPKLRSAFDNMIDQMALDPKARGAMKSLFASFSAEDAPGLLVRYMAYLGLGQGRAFELGEPLAYDTRIPFPLGGPPVAGRAQFLLESYDEASGRAVIVWTQAMDAESLRAATAHLVRTMMEKAGQPVDGAAFEAEFAKLAIKAEDRCRFDIDRLTGLALRTECGRSMVAMATGEVMRNDAWIITQTLPEKR